MPHFRAVFNGSRIVNREVKKKGAFVTEAKQTGGAVIQAKALALPKVEDKKALRRKMAQELMKTL